MCEENKSPEDNLRRLLELLDKCEILLKGHRKLKKIQAKFTEDLIMSVGMATYDYFSTQPARPELVLKGEISEEEIIEQLAADTDIPYYVIWLSEHLVDLIKDFSGDSVPADKKLYHRKIEYESYSDEAVAEHANRLIEECNIQDPEDQELLYDYCKEDALVGEFYDNFDMLLHKILKKLALKYFPQISDVSGTGLKEIDYMLYTYMRMLRDNMMVILENVNVEVDLNRTIPAIPQ